MPMNKAIRKNGVLSRKPRNPTEAECFEYMESQGWTCTKRGYPDFVCYKGEDLCFVEVKPTENYVLKSEQEKLMNALTERGLKCYKYTADGGLVLHKVE